MSEKERAFYNLYWISTTVGWDLSRHKNLKTKVKKMGIKGKTDKMAVLACDECKRRNYTTVKNKKTNKERMELSKYCPFCKTHKKHKETK